MGFDIRREQMARMTVPTLIVWALKIPFGDVREAERMHALVAGSELEILTNCGHWPQHEHAARLTN
jgi:2-hydroxy-6-oxonona-2,4-dienedioate hydrolase